MQIFRFRMFFQDLDHDIVSKGSSSFHFDPSLSLTENYHLMDIKFKSDWAF